MCDRSAPVAQAARDDRTRARARLDEHRHAWERNEALRSLYAGWYERIRLALPSPDCGAWLELGSGPGFAREFIPDLVLSDLVAVPWVDVATAAENLPVRDASLGALVLFDVLHHLAHPSQFFVEATRALAPGGRIVVCDPFVSPLSYPVYRFLHEEGLDTRADPFVQTASPDKDPFAGNQAVATLMLIRQRDEFHRRFPGLQVRALTRFAGPAYPASGGFGARPLVPLTLWRWLDRLESRLPEAAFRLVGFRMLAVIERV